MFHVWGIEQPIFATKSFPGTILGTQKLSTNLSPILLPHSVYLLYLFTNYQSCICSSHNFEHIDFFSLYLHQPAWPRCIIISSVVTQSANKKSATSSKQLLHIDWLATTAPFFSSHSHVYIAPVVTCKDAAHTTLMVFSGESQPSSSREQTGTSSLRIWGRCEVM